MMAQNKLAKECGFESIIPGMWLGPVRSMASGGDMFVSWDGLWMERAEGVSLDTLIFKKGRDRNGTKTMVNRTIVHYLLTKKCAHASEGIPQYRSAANYKISLFINHQELKLNN